jgi:hypothetical protein
MGFQVDSETTVQHLAVGEDKIASALAVTLFGSVATDEPEFLAIASVQVGLGFFVLHPAKSILRKMVDASPKNSRCISQNAICARIHQSP